MKKLFAFFLLAACTICILSGCWMLAERFSCNPDEVEYIAIVRLDGFDTETKEYIVTVLCEIEDIPTFAQELNSIPYRTNLGEPDTVEPGDIVIQIDYKNGNQDYIEYNAQIERRPENDSAGYVWFDREAFEALIAKYVDLDTLR